MRLQVFLINYKDIKSNKFNFIAPKLSETLNAKSQSENSYFQIYCTVEKGSDPLFFEWSINGSNIKSSPEVHYKIDNFERYSTFTIKKLNRKDSANYGCVVSNQYGSDAQNIQLKVKGGIVLITMLKIQT